jgi:hypothetical protein
MSVLYSLLCRIFGNPNTADLEEFIEFTWNNHGDNMLCILYKKHDAYIVNDAIPLVLQTVYGDFVGGMLLRGVLKVAFVAPVSVYGFYAIGELNRQPEVTRASLLDSEVLYFMDSANIWFYGIKNESLYCYDSDTDELEQLGPIESSFEQVFMDWIIAKK